MTRGCPCLVLVVVAADAEQAHLDPQQHLRAGRHGEWVAETLQVRRQLAGICCSTTAVLSAVLSADHVSANTPALARSEGQLNLL